MNKNFSVSFALLVLFLLFFVGLPKNSSDSLRSFAVASFSPAWHSAGSFQRYLSDRPIGKKRSVDLEELCRLQLENQMLKAELELIRDAKFAKTFLSATPAKVIYRDPSSWSSSLWIDVGKEESFMIEKNSPVVVGNSLIGVVDYVGKKQSRVRLITDSGVSPAVRAVRGEVQNRHLALELQTLCELLKARGDLERFIPALDELAKQLKEEKETLMLAKGELQGSSAPLWRSRGPVLKGIGFNFDFPDEGEKRPEGIPILKEGDLLVTSGLDGIFPPGLFVGTVISVEKGNYCYGLKALPTAKDLNHLQTVYVLPAVNNE